MRWLGLLGWAIGLPLQAEPKRDFARGVLEEARGGSGAEWFEKARTQDPGAWNLTTRVAERMAADGGIEAASTLYREFAAAHPRRLEAQLAYADFLRESTPGDDFAAKLACEVLEKARADSPGDLTVIRRLFRAYEQRGMRESAIGLFDQVSATEGGAAALAAAEMARTLFAGDDPEVRARLDGIFRKAVSRTPQDPVLARAASEHFRRSGRLPEAVAMLETHTAAQPSSLALRVRLGILLVVAERTDEGEAVLEQVLVIDPGQALAHETLAKLYRRQERVDEALPHAAEVLRIRGGDAGEFTELAQEFIAADMPREARLLLEKGLFDHPDDAALAVNLAIATRRDPEAREGASRLFREAESLSGTEGPATKPAFLREFAECLLEEGDTAAAEERLRAAIRSYPPDAKKETADALRRLAGVWQAEKRNPAAAHALLQRAESLDP